MHRAFLSNVKTRRWPMGALLWAFPTLGLLAACSGGGSTTASDTTFPKDALQIMACDTNALQIEIRTAPVQPPTAGLDGVEVVLTDPTTHAPVEDAQISLVPWMPLMGHGADLNPVVTKMGKGRYVITNVNLYMPGEWQLRFQFTFGKTTCSAEPTFNVP
jgi:hypothetical protein